MSTRTPVSTPTRTPPAPDLSAGHAVRVVGPVPDARLAVARGLAGGLPPTATAPPAPLRRVVLWN